jgi:hypothetical protein
MNAGRTIFRRCRDAALRLHHDERGGMMDYLLVLAAVGIPLILLSGFVPQVAFKGTMMQILTNYYASLAFNVGWPFL